MVGVSVIRFVHNGIRNLLHRLEYPRAQINRTMARGQGRNVAAAHAGGWKSDLAHAVIVEHGSIGVRQKQTSGYGRSTDLEGLDQVSLRKRIASSTVFNEIVSFFVYAYLWLCYATTRWDHEGLDEMNECVRSNQPVLTVIWHERLWMSPFLFDTTLGKICSITSESRIAYTGKFLLRRFDFESIMIDPKKNPVGLNRQLFRRIREGYSIAISPDGTRGPPRVAKSFPITWARKTRMPIFCATFAMRWRLKTPTWDRSHIPLPFNRGVLMVRRWTEEIPKDASPEDIEVLTRKLEGALNTLTDEADTMVGRKPGRQ